MKDKPLPRPEYMGWGCGISNPLHPVYSELQTAVKRGSKLVEVVAIDGQPSQWPNHILTRPSANYRVRFYVYAGGLVNVSVCVLIDDEWVAADREARGPWWDEIRRWLRDVHRENTAVNIQYAKAEKHKRKLEEKQRKRAAQFFAREYAFACARIEVVKAK